MGKVIGWWLLEKACLADGKISKELPDEKKYEDSSCGGLCFPPDNWTMTEEEAINDATSQVNADGGAEECEVVLAMKLEDGSFEFREFLCKPSKDGWVLESPSCGGTDIRRKLVRVDLPPTAPQGVIVRCCACGGAFCLVQTVIRGKERYCYGCDPWQLGG